MALGSIQPLTEMSTRNLPGGKGWLARKADNLTAICELTVLKNVGASMSYNSMACYRDRFTSYLYTYCVTMCAHIHNLYFLHKFVGTGYKIITILI
jgi:hypothetical protein